MRSARVWARLLGVEKTTVVRVEFDEDAGVLVAHVKPHKSQRQRCPMCQRRCPLYDRGAGRRQWRALDLSTLVAWLEPNAWDKEELNEAPFDSPRPEWLSPAHLAHVVSS